MSDDEFDEDEEPELDEDALDEDELEDNDLEEDDALDDDNAEPIAIDDDVATDVAVEEPVGTAAETAAETTDEDDVLDLDEELHPDDVEEPLDVLLQERTASAKLEDEDEEAEEEEPDTDERGDGATKIVPRRPGEFLCSSCFLVLPRNQLADANRMLCRDCA
jgi:hypothetical protein